MMKKCLFILAVLSFLVMPAIAQEAASEVKKITVEEAVALAADNNITLKRQKLSLDLLETRKKTSWNSISPTASVSSSYSLPIEENPTTAWSVTASVNLALTPSLYTAIRGAQINYENGLISYEKAIRTIELNVRKTFYSLLLTKENLTLQKRNLETARQNYVSNLDKYNKGRLSELNLLNSQYTYESLKPAIESAEINYENSLGTFKQMLGIAQDVEIELVGNLNDYLKLSDISIDENFEVENLPALKTLQGQIDSAQNSLLATRFTAWGPSLSASYSYGVSGNSMTDQTKTTNSLSFGVRLPLDGYLPWSNGALSIKAQKTTLKDLQLQMENEKTSAALAIQTNLKKIKQAQSQLAAYEKNITLAQRKYNATLTSYNYGSADFLTLQNASDSLFSARLNRQSQILTLISSILDLEDSLGLPFGTLSASTEGK